MQFLLSSFINTSQLIFRLTSSEKNWKLIQAKIMQCTFFITLVKKTLKQILLCYSKKTRMLHYFYLANNICDYVPFSLCSLMPP